MSPAIKKPEHDREAVLSKAIISICHELELDNKDIAAIVGISPSSITRLFQGTYRIKADSPNEGDKAKLFLRIYRSLSTLVGGNPKHMKSWLKTFNRDIGEVPLEAVKSTQGIVYVADYLDAMRGKI